MGKQKRRFTSAFLAALITLTCSPITPAARAYSDSENTWAAEVIEKAGAYGLMNGYPDGRFGVGDPMKRVEFVTVLTRMFDWDAAAPASPTYIDCPADYWGFSAMETAAAHGVLDPGGSIRPEDYISRAEMAQMLVRALGYTRLAQSLSNTALPFPDVSSDKGYISIAYDLGIINGVEEKGQLKFLPTFSAPREQAAAMLVRCYERYTSSTSWLHGFYATSSFSQLDYTDAMDAVSVGWARLEYTDGALTVNDTASNNNDWVKPEGSELVTGRLAANSIPCNLNVFASASTFASLVAAGLQTEAVNRLTAAARPYSGLTIDLEGLKTDQRENFSLFMASLRSALPAQQSLYVCVQPDTWFGGYDYRALGESCDKVILMAHDYQWSSIPDYYVGTDNTYCPVTPFDQVYTALKHLTDPATGVQDLSRAALAVSFNTTGFHVDENGLLLDTTFYHPGKDTIAKRIQQPDSLRVWDEASHNPCLTYTTEDGGRYKLWYEDAQSVADKLQLARMFGVTSVSVWRLGTIPDYKDIPNYDVWTTLSTR